MKGVAANRAIVNPFPCIFLPTLAYIPGVVACCVCTPTISGGWYFYCGLAAETPSAISRLFDVGVYFEDCPTCIVELACPT